jgi:hypothetical protein
MESKKAKRIIEDYFQSWNDVPEIIYRSDYHFSIIYDYKRLDIWPTKRKRFHLVFKDERGSFDSLEELLMKHFPQP